MLHCRNTAVGLAVAGLLTLAISPAAAQAPTAQGQQPPPNMAEAFIQQHDTDGDGSVSQAELLAPQEARFKELDANGDGVVTAEEFRQSFESQIPAEARERMKERGLEDPTEAFVKQLDSNGDGKVQRAEALQPTVEGFGRMDANGDGFVTEDEADDFLRAMWEQMQQMHQPPAQ